MWFRINRTTNHNQHLQTIKSTIHSTQILMSEQTKLIPGNSLITATPEDGRILAVKMARLIIKITQPDAEIREQLRPKYANDAAMLIAIGQTVATEFATIAKANEYWK